MFWRKDTPEPLFEHVKSEPIPGSPGLELQTFRVRTGPILPKRIWSVKTLATGEVCECRNVRRLLYVIYAPWWYQRAVMDLSDFWFGLRKGFWCEDCSTEYRVFHTCVNEEAADGR